MKLRMIVDDERTFIGAPDGQDDGLGYITHYARTSWDALRVLAAAATVDELWLDHDLGGKDTTMPVVDFLCAVAHPDYQGPTGPRVRQILVHSMNPSGAERIIKALTAAGYKVGRTGVPGCV